jgi:polysaccharide deacetylase family protein (PEP-CTERM system associated)
MQQLTNRCVLSIDVEEWFHLLELRSVPPMAEWDKMPPRVERNFLRLLEITAENGVHCTCFFVGWIARRYPNLVRAAASQGHEIASHGWAHKLASRMTPEEFYQDAELAKKVIEDISGYRVLGYRSAGFSLCAENTWVFDELLRAGYNYDASVFPAPRAHGGWRNGHFAPYEVVRPLGTIIEFPMTVEKVLGLPICFSGGGYLRIAPLPLIMRLTRRVLRSDRPVVFYVHPREIDQDQPRLEMNRWRRFKTYVNLQTTEWKLQQVLSAFEFSTFAEFLLPQPGEMPRIRRRRAPLRRLVPYEDLGRGTRRTPGERAL